MWPVARRGVPVPHLITLTPRTQASDTFRLKPPPIQQPLRPPMPASSKVRAARKKRPGPPPNAALLAVHSPSPKQHPVSYRTPIRCQAWGAGRIGEWLRRRCNAGCCYVCRSCFILSCIRGWFHASLPASFLFFFLLETLASFLFLSFANWC